MHIQHLANGLKVVVVPSSSAPVVAMQAWVGVGSAYEDPTEAGAAHFLEHMLFKGTRRRRVGELAREVEAAGGDINAWTDFNNTAYHLVLGSRYFDLGLDVLADAVLNPALDAEEVERERQVILEEIQQGEDSPSRVNFQQLFGLAFGRHPYARPVIGLRETVAALDAKALRRFHRRWYAPGNLHFVVAGDVDPEKVVRQVQRGFRGRARELPERQPRPGLSQRQPRVSVRYAPVSDAYLLAAFHIPGLTHQDLPSLDLAATLLGQGDSSRLQRQVLREEQLVTDVSAFTFAPHDVGLFVLGATLEPQRLEAAVEAICLQAYRLSSEPVGRDEVDKARLLTEATAVMQGETAPGLARKAGYFQYAAGDPGFETEYLDRVRAVTPATVRAISARYLSPGSLSVAVVLPEGSLSGPEQRDTPRRLVSLCKAVHKSTTKGRRVPVPAPGKGGVIRTTLHNGLTLLVRPDSTVPLVAVRAVWRGGLRYESKRTNGINALLSSVLVRGTSSRSGDQIAEAVEAMAGSIGGFTGRNSLGIRLETLSRFWVESLEILSDCLCNPAFPEEEVTRERQLALQEIATRDDNLTGAVFRLFQEALYRRHPYRFSLGGETASVSKLGRMSLVRHFRKHCRPGGLVLSVVGDVEPESVLREVTRFLGDGAPPTGALPTIPQEGAPGAPVSVIRNMDRQQAHVLLGFLGASVRDKDRFALEVLAAVLSGQGGRLFMHIRDRLGLVYRINAFSMEGLDPGYFGVYAATSPDQVDTLVAQIRASLGQLRSKPVGSGELQRAKRYLVGHHDLSLQQRATLGSVLAFNELYGLGYDAHLAYARSIRAVTAGDLQRVARKTLASRREVLATVLPEGKGEISHGGGSADHGA